MPGGKIHGGGGHGRESRERRRSLKHQEAAKEKVERAQEKRFRYQEKKFKMLAEHFTKHIQPIASKAMQRIQEAIKPKVHGKQLIRQQATIRLLAIDSWYHEAALKKARELKIEHMLEPEKFHFLDYSQREHLWRDIISPKIINGQKTTPRSIEDTKEEIIKWKSRVPKLAQGEY